MINLESGYLKDLANNIINTGKHSLEPLDVLLLIDSVLMTRGETLEPTNFESSQLASPGAKAQEGVVQETLGAGAADGAGLG